MNTNEIPSKKNQWLSRDMFEFNEFNWPYEICYAYGNLSSYIGGIASAKMIHEPIESTDIIEFYCPHCRNLEFITVEESKNNNKKRCSNCNCKKDIDPSSLEEFRISTDKS